VFTLGALSFGVAALAVWAMGIETKGLELETLVSRVQPEVARLRVAIEEVREIDAYAAIP
jgi:putative MFS transporter